ncbi:hypothetical protein B0H17DRAFT_1128757 [Mycena rosella]|uniref:Uncharacterized protein n=1 Tax=Mycena rosella TaxID=1033263 RepID=A0AAD7GQ10_MYCRO|nr:hypothetical protein B0H17DRAFT_1128757 [Mycena rosella]
MGDPCIYPGDDLQLDRKKRAEEGNNCVQPALRSLSGLSGLADVRLDAHVIRLRKSNLNTPHLRAHFSANSGLIDMIPGIGAPGFTFWFHIQIPMGQESSGFKKINQELNENGQSEPVVRKTGVEF